MSSAQAALILLPQDFGCPAWCERSDHDADAVGPTNPPTHYGPDFGVFWTEQKGDEFFVRAREEGLENLTLARVRQIAVDALTALAWVETARGVASPRGPEVVR